MSFLIKNNKTSSIKQFKNHFKGEIITPSDTKYDDSRKVFNGMINKHPSIIAFCTDVEDVVSAVNFARENELKLAIRGGGHNAGGLGICDDGLVIDMSGIKFVDVNTKDNTVKVGGGNIWREVDKATHAFGLAIPSGIVSSTGVGGLTLGGGIGYLSRKHGLSIDNLLEAEMVLADGSFVTVNSTQNQDLFWAIRGGGGNFGVVTSFKFQAHPLTNIFGGVTLWPIEDLNSIMEWYDNFIQNAPETLSGFIATMIIPGAPFPEHLHNKQFCGIAWCYSGDLNLAKKEFEPILAKKPLFDHLGKMPFPAMQSLFDGLFPSGMQWYWRADFFNELGPEIRKEHLKFGSDIPTPLSQMHLYPISGAAGRVGSKDTPWAFRGAKYAGVIVGVDPDPANKAKITNWCKEYWKALHPYSAGGAYSNFMMDEGQDRVKASYGHNYKRLAQIKKQYDPENLFRVNQNIVPS